MISFKIRQNPLDAQAQFDEIFLKVGSPTIVAFKSSYAQNVSSSFGSIQVELHRIVVMKVEMCELRRVVELDTVLPTLPNFLKIYSNI